MEAEAVCLAAGTDLDLEGLAVAFKALGHPKRLRIFEMLMEGVQCSCEISRRLGLGLSLISHHMRILEDTGLVHSQRDNTDARWIYYSIDAGGLARLRDATGHLLDQKRIQPRLACCGPGGSEVVDCDDAEGGRCSPRAETGPA